MVRPPASPARTATGKNLPWLAVGPGSAHALSALGRAGPAKGSVLHAESVYEALDRVQRASVRGCVLAAALLKVRPAAQLQALRDHLGERTQIFVVGSTGSTKQDRRLRRLGVRPLKVVLPKVARGREPAKDPAAPGARFALDCLRRAHDPEALDELLLRTFSELSDARRIAIFRRRGGRMTLVAGRGVPAELIGHAHVGKGESLAARALHLRRPLVGRAAQGGARGYAGEAYAILPLMTLKRAEGLLCLTNLPADATPDARALLHWGKYVAPAAQAIGIARQWARARRRSGHDRLTGLPNRAAFERALTREVERAVRAGSGLAVGLLDVDRFKDVNDTHGHPAGDRVLRAVGRRLADAFRGTDLVARYGGEEFAVLLPSPRPPPPDKALDALERARLGVRQEPIALDDRGSLLRVTISGGVAILGLHGREPGELLKAADQALYAAKQAGRDRVLAAP